LLIPQLAMSAMIRKITTAMRILPSQGIGSSTTGSGGGGGGGGGGSFTNHLPRMVAPHFSQGTSDGPRSQCGQATILPPEKASETSQSDRPQVLQGPRELKSWKWSHLGHFTAET